MSSLTRMGLGKRFFLRETWKRIRGRDVLTRMLFKFFSRFYCISVEGDLIFFVGSTYKRYIFNFENSLIFKKFYHMVIF